MGNNLEKRSSCIERYKHKLSLNSRGSYLQEAILSFNNWRSYRSAHKYTSDQIIVLCPHCLQKSDCPHKIIVNAANCKKCGKCSVKDLVEITDRYDIRIHFVAGGREAVRIIKNPETKAIIAVACGKELFLGFLKTSGKHVITVHNVWPHGPCKDTMVDYTEVEEAIQFLIKK
ncbi:MAG: DUF116 domain-containing protein [Candidatus Ancaeobacter aquaticus]|nr:DUF116 domain-containing protein [Candidatus Ancaeobacter aquaticus]